MKRVFALFLSVLFLLAPAALADGYDDILIKGDAYLQQNEYEKALACCKLAQMENPDSAEAYLLEAETHLAAGDVSAASFAANDALDVEPLLPEVWELRCRIDLLCEDAAAFDENRIYAEVCGVDLSDCNAEIAAMYADEGYLQRAVEYFALTEPDSLNEKQRLMYRSVLIESGQYERAAELGLVMPFLRNEELDTAFENGSLKLTGAELPIVSAQDFVFTEEMVAYIWEEEYEELDADALIDELYAALDVFLKEEQPTPLSLSPSGNSGLWELDGIDLVSYNGQFRIIHPSTQRGVEDTYETQSEYLKRPIRFHLHNENVVYSPDGRYAAAYSSKEFVENLRCYSPMIIDLSTGEVILLASYGSKSIRDDNFGSVINACFSQGGRYFYYSLYSNDPEAHTSLYRYDLLKNVIELCYESADWVWNSALLETEEGTLLTMCARKNTHDAFGGPVYLAHKDGEWTYERYDFAEYCEKHWYFNRLLNSSASGWAMVIGDGYSDVSFDILSRFRPDEDFSTMNQFWAISKAEERMVLLSEEDIEAVVKQLQQEASEEQSVKSAVPYHTIEQAAFSPDGHYAILLTASTADQATESELNLYLLRMQDMEIKKISMPESVELSDVRVPIEWRNDTLLLGADNQLRCFRFE